MEARRGIAQRSPVLRRSCGRLRKFLEMLRWKGTRDLSGEGGCGGARGRMVPRPGAPSASRMRMSQVT